MSGENINFPFGCVSTAQKKRWKKYMQVMETFTVYSVIERGFVSHIKAIGPGGNVEFFMDSRFPITLGSHIRIGNLTFKS